MFSRQHYQKFAEILKKMHGKDQELLATELIHMFKQDNPRFNAEMFAKAAGLEGNTRLHNVIFAHESAQHEQFGSDIRPGAKVRIKTKGHENTPWTVEKWHKGGYIVLDPQRKRLWVPPDHIVKENVNESFENFGMKLMPLIPVGKLTERAFHGGNPTAQDIDDYHDDVEDAWTEAEETIDKTFDTILDFMHESELKDLEMGVKQQITLFRKAMAAFRQNVWKVFEAKRKRLGGR